ncbi:MAG: Rne/Rng family ribonuclease [Prevotella sp.]|jgi:ribonuclease G|nr:Rne/Rng family ribonuclease [Prevotella sp.]
MNSELIINAQPQEVSIAVLEDKKLVELQKETRDAPFAVSNIYAGKVKKLMPGLNAAFVDIGYKKDAFLHYLDLGHQFRSIDNFYKQALADKRKFPQISKSSFEPDLEKEGSIADILKVGQEILVQITKEPISTKGPRLTAEISFAGRYIVLIPFNNKISVSQKIRSKEERARLRQLIQSIKPKNFGVIVRTVAEGKKVAELDVEMRLLLKAWDDNFPKIQKNKLPSLVYEETARTVALLRDVFNPDFSEIHINDKEIYGQVKDYISVIAPEKKDIVKLYSGELPIFDNFSVTKQIKALFGRTVTFRNGAYLIIEHTEALHVIDVNSGNRAKNQQLGQENNAFEVNSAAAEEVARQLRLRDMGGIIVIDFIDMGNSEHRNKLLQKMMELMSSDRARHNILPLSKFGLMQITRQRVRPEMEIATTETCPTCFGKGEIKPSILFTDSLQSKISYLVNKLRVKKFTLHVHPYIAAFINQGFLSLKWKWKLRYTKELKIIPNQSLAFLEYHFYDENSEEIDLKQEIELK